MKKKITIILLLGIVFLPISVLGQDVDFTYTPMALLGNVQDRMEEPHMPVQ